MVVLIKQGQQGDECLLADRFAGIETEACFVAWKNPVQGQNQSRAGGDVAP